MRILCISEVRAFRELSNHFNNVYTGSCRSNIRPTCLMSSIGESRLLLKAGALHLSHRRRVLDHESLLPNTSACATLAKLDGQGKERAARECDEKLLAPLDDTIGKALGKWVGHFSVKSRATTDTLDFRPIRIRSHP